MDITTQMQSRDYDAVLKKARRWIVAGYVCLIIFTIILNWGRNYFILYFESLGVQYEIASLYINFLYLVHPLCLIVGAAILTKVFKHVGLKLLSASILMFLMSSDVYWTFIYHLSMGSVIDYLLNAICYGLIISTYCSLQKNIVVDKYYMNKLHYGTLIIMIISFCYIVFSFYGNSADIDSIGSSFFQIRYLLFQIVKILAVILIIQGWRGVLEVPCSLQTIEVPVKRSFKLSQIEWGYIVSILLFSLICAIYALFVTVKIMIWK